MMKIRVVESFEGYPFPPPDEARKRTFIAGAEVDVSDEFGALVVGKGQAENISAAPKVGGKRAGTEEVAS